MTPVVISIVSAAVAVTSLLFNFITLKLRRDLEKRAEIARLHEMWWSEELKAAREEVIGFVLEWEKSDKKETAILRSYRTNEGYDRERKTIGRIAYFFSDLNAFIDEGLASEKFAYRLFAQSQFYYFSEFLISAARILEERMGSDTATLPRKPRWPEEVRKLDKRFRRIDASTAR